MKYSTIILAALASSASAQSSPLLPSGSAPSKPTGSFSGGVIPSTGKGLHSHGQHSGSAGSPVGTDVGNFQNFAPTASVSGSVPTVAPSGDFGGGTGKKPTGSARRTISASLAAREASVGKPTGTPPSGFQSAPSGAAEPSGSPPPPPTGTFSAPTSDATRPSGPKHSDSRVPPSGTPPSAAPPSPTGSKPLASIEARTASFEKPTGSKTAGSIPTGSVDSAQPSGGRGGSRPSEGSGSGLKPSGSFSGTLPSGTGAQGPTPTITVREIRQAPTESFTGSFSKPTGTGGFGGHSPSGGATPSGTESRTFSFPDGSTQTIFPSGFPTTLTTFVRPTTRA